MSTCVEAV